MKEKANTSTKMFLFRFGLTILALLALHAFVTIYKQLGQASLILNELAQSAMIPVRYEKDMLNKQTKHLSLPNHAASGYVTKSPAVRKQRFLEVNPHSGGQEGGHVRTHFQESVFAYERRFYQDDHTTSPTYFEETNGSPHSQSTKKPEKTEHIHDMKRIREKSGNKKDTHRATSNQLQYNESNNKNNKNSESSSNSNNEGEDNNSIHNKNNTSNNNNDRRDNNKNENNDNKHISNRNNNSNNHSNSKYNFNDNNNNNSNKIDKIMKEHSNSKTKPNPSPSKVIIIAYRRSGSSFIGEMFNRNPRVFYLFEPFHPVEKIAGMGKHPLLYDTMVGHVLDVIYTCSFNKHPFLVNFLSKSPFRLKSEVLKGSRLCETNATPQNLSRSCKRLDATTLKGLCNSKEHTVVKTIRTGIKKILDHSAESSSDSKSDKLNLVHLVRDPRAIISSRLHLFFRNEINSAVALKDYHNLTDALRRSVRVASANLCSRIQSDIEYGRRANANRYMFLRYEDAAMRPLKIYQKLSKFSGIRESEMVKDWLGRNTHVADAHKENDEYSTSRNSTATVNSWRRRMPYALVAEVQSQCAEIMNILRYIPARNERELMDVAKSLVSYDKTM